MNRSSASATVAVLLGCGLGCTDHQAPPVARTGPPPIVLLSIDTFRADRIGAYGNSNGLTPNLDAFAAEAVVFEHAYSQAVQTAPSHTSMFTSRYPSEQLGADGQPYVYENMPLLAELLSLYGYQTGAFVGGGDLSPYRGLNEGFDVYEYPKDFGSFYHTGPAALAWLDTIEAERPFFMFLHGYDAHSRYLKPPPYGYAYSDARIESQGQAAVRSESERVVDGVVYPDQAVLISAYQTELRPRSETGKAKFKASMGGAVPEYPSVGDSDIELIRDVYDGAVSYADTMIGLFLATLEERGILDEAVVVILSDHGEQLGENGLFGHCCEANDVESHVPLMVRLPGGKGGGHRVSAFVELVDVMPTLLELVDVPPPRGIHGRSLMTALSGGSFEGREYAFTEGSEIMRLLSMRGPKGRFTFTGLSPSSGLLDDILEVARIDGPSFEADPGLTLTDRAEMREEMVAWLRTLKPSPGTSPSAGPMPDSLKKALREHGYWDVKQ